MKNFLAAAITAAFLLHPAWAQDGEGAEPSDTFEACTPLAMDPAEAEGTLRNFGNLFGKDAIRWTRKDFDQVVTLARACDGVMFSNGNVVKAADWKRHIDAAMVDVLPIAIVQQKVQQLSQYLRPDKAKLPSCEVLATYHREPDRFEDNSATIYQVPLWGLDIRDLDLVVEHANNCRAFLPVYGARVYGIDGKAAGRALEGIMDRALLFKEYQRAWNQWGGRRTTDLLVDIAGYPVPPTFASPETQALVRRFNRAANGSGGMSVGTVFTILSHAEAILRKEPADIDLLFIEAVKTGVNGDIFERTGL